MTLDLDFVCFTVGLALIVASFGPLWAVGVVVFVMGIVYATLTP